MWLGLAVPGKNQLSQYLHIKWSINDDSAGSDRPTELTTQGSLWFWSGEIVSAVNLWTRFQEPRTFKDLKNCPETLLGTQELLQPFIGTKMFFQEPKNPF